MRSPQSLASPLGSRGPLRAQPSATARRPGEGGRSALQPRMTLIEPSPVRVVTYNVLSSSLCEPDYYVKCKPGDLDPTVRLARVKEQLSPHLEVGAVICLQEVSSEWAGDLHSHFERHGYSFVTGLYGSRFNGYMGVGLAWPTARFTSEAVDISRASDTKPWPQAPPLPPPPPKPTNAPAAALAALRAGWEAGKGVCFASWRKWVDGPPPLDPWKEAQRRENILLSARLKCRASGALFSVSTYHMPCLFGSDSKLQVMTVHAALAARHAAAFAGEGVPFVLAGDWNFKPQDAPYELFRQGALPKGNRHLPAPRESDAWAPELEGRLASAYAICNGREPEFTNKAWTRGASESFVGTLDYIFLGCGGVRQQLGPAPPEGEGGGATPAGEEPGARAWRVLKVKPLKALSAVEGVLSYPVADEPSDHVLIWADLQLPPATPRAAA